MCDRLLLNCVCVCVIGERERERVEIYSKSKHIVLQRHRESYIVELSYLQREREREFQVRRKSVKRYNDF